jgi:protein-disulfide isomerase
MYPATRKILFPSLLFLFIVSVSAPADLIAASTVGTPTGVVAEVEGEKITAEQLEKSIAVELSNLQEQIYNLKREKLEAMVNERLLSLEAARQKVSVPQLLDREITSKVTLVTEQEVDAFYEANKAKIKDGPQVRPQIRQYLQNQSLATQREKYIQALRSKAKIRVNLQPPPPLRVAVGFSGAPFRGGEKAAVTIIKFEDFQCPFCRQTQPTFAQLESRYGNKIKVVHRDFPIDNSHPQARRAAEGARCANEQGKFWNYHDKLYATNLTSDPNQLSALAKETGLDVALFDRCLASGQYKAAVQKDLEQGKQLGVTATPAFFINGRLIVGAQPLETFTRIIDEELASTTSSAPSR